MIKRLRWLTIGSLFGAGGSMWLQRRVRAFSDRHAAVRGTATVAGSARRMSRDLREAWTDGRREMRDTEARLRERQDW
jgi:hypothetical protein